MIEHATITVIDGEVHASFYRKGVREGTHVTRGADALPLIEELLAQVRVSNVKVSTRPKFM